MSDTQSILSNSWIGGNVTTGNITQNILQPQEQPTKVFNALPLSPYKLVGRNDLLNSLKQQLLGGNSIALQGLPGVGKTELALQLAYNSELRNHFKDGVLWAGLGRNADFVATLLEWSTVLRISQSEKDKLLDNTSREKVVEALRRKIQEKITDDDKRLLLVIDDVWEFEAALALKIGVPNCAYIATTRFMPIAFDFAGEGARKISELSESSSLELLRLVSGDIVETHQDEAKELAKAVGYLPLALILMGRYLKKESSGRLSRRIEDALKNLQQTEKRLRLEQSQTSLGSNPSLRARIELSLLAVIEISDETLDDEAKLAFRALSVFPPKPNTFSEEAALAVSLSADVAALDRLFNSGLLESDSSGRYMLHQTLADYSREKLTDRTVYERMAAFYADYVENNVSNYKLISQEYNNIIAALRMANKMKMYLTAVRGINAFYPFLEARGLYEEAETILNEVQKESRFTSAVCGWAEIFLNLGRVTKRSGKYSESKENLQRAIVLADKGNCNEVIVYSKMNLGILEEVQGDDGDAKKFYDEAVDLAKLTENNKAVSILYSSVGSLLVKSQNYSEAREKFKDGLTAAIKVEDEQTICGLLINLGLVEIILGNFDEAKAYYQKSLTIVRKLRHYEFFTYIRQGMGELAKERGVYEQAEHHYKRGLALANRIGLHEREITLLQNLGALLAIQRKYEKADEFFQKALSLASQIKHFELVDHIIKNLVRLATIQADHDTGKIDI